MQIHKVTVQGLGFEPWILCPLYISFTPGKIFSELWSNVHLSGTMCRTQPWGPKVKVTSLSLEFGVSFTQEGFSLNVGQMFATVRWCAEPITQQCWLKVKVTVEGHQFEPWSSSPLHCHSDCLVKFGSNVRLSEMMCRTYVMQTQGQGHNWRSTISFLFAPYLLNSLKDFHETSVKCLP